MVIIDGNHLTLEDVMEVARFGSLVEIGETGKKGIQESRKRVEEIVSTGKPVYGINTGFGIFAEQRIALSDSSQLSRNLILSHAVGTGPDLPDAVVRASMLVRANTLTKGYSGVRLEVVQTLIDMLNNHITPIVPAQGSLGSSGDLIPLSHMALVFTTDNHDRQEDSGEAYFKGCRLSGKEAMQKAGIPRIILQAKEGLALNNGATFSAAIAALCILDAEYLANIADLALSLTLEAVLGCSSAFDNRLHQARGHDGQIRVASNVRQMTHGSTFINATSRVQDAYSLRCAPQVHGAARDTINFVRNIIENEINAATDNPLIFEPAEAISGGNFHGEPIGMMMDYLGIALAEIGAISERRIFRLTDGKLNGGLPPMLVDNFKAAGLNSGLMMPQYTAASLVLENQTLATPDSVHSLPTSGEQEDHNANSMTAARHGMQIIENTTTILAIELYTASRALYLRMRDHPELKPGETTSKLYQKLQSIVPFQPGDAWWGPEIEKVKRLIELKEIPDL